MRIPFIVLNYNYEGEWIDDKFHGLEHWMHGDRYGKGTMKYANGGKKSEVDE